MSATAAAGDVGRKPEGVRVRALEPGEVAWVLVLPCAVLALLAIVLLGPPLGRAFLEPGSDRFFPDAVVAPEPTEHARYLLALLAPVLLAAATAASTRRPLRLAPGPTRVLVLAAQTCTAAFALEALLAQYDVLFRGNVPPDLLVHFFSVPAIAVSALAALALAAALGRRRLLERLEPLVRETRGRRVLGLAVATALVVTWAASAFNTDTTLARAIGANLITWDMSEAFAVLDGRTPLLDFHSQYSNLVPYAAAWSMRVLGTSAGGWTGFMVILDGLALLAVYAVFRRVVGRSLLALALFVPFVVGGFSNAGTPISPLNVFSVWPMRYAPPYLLAWLTARHLDAVAPRRRRLLLLAAALVALNNVEFGIPALGATLAALVLTDPPRSRRAIARICGDVGLGVLGAVALVAALTLVHGGGLPHLGLIFEFSRIYGVSGWVLERMPTVALHLAVYATFAAGVVVATVRAVRDDDGRVLTGMLVWSGVFGFGAASYFVGRSDELDLMVLQSAWCFALLLLAVVVVRALAARSRRPAVTDVAVLFGCALAACGVVQTPMPWTQVSRLRDASPQVFKLARATRLVERTSRPGEKIATLIPLGYRVAFDAGVVDVAPYSSSESIPTVQQMQTTVDAMLRVSVRHVYVALGFLYRGQPQMLLAAGYRVAARAGPFVMLERR